MLNEYEVDKKSLSPKPIDFRSAIEYAFWFFDIPHKTSPPEMEDPTKAVISLSGMSEDDIAEVSDWEVMKNVELLTFTYILLPDDVHDHAIYSTQSYKQKYPSIDSITNTYLWGNDTVRSSILDGYKKEFATKTECKKLVVNDSIKRLPYDSRRNTIYKNANFVYVPEYEFTYAFHVLTSPSIGYVKKPLVRLGRGIYMNEESIVPVDFRNSTAVDTNIKDFLINSRSKRGTVGAEYIPLSYIYFVICLIAVSQSVPYDPQRKMKFSDILSCYTDDGVDTDETTLPFLTRHILVDPKTTSGFNPKEMRRSLFHKFNRRSEENDDQIAGGKKSAYSYSRMIDISLKAQRLRDAL